MKFRRLIVLSIVFAGLCLPSSAKSLLSLLFPPHDVQVITNADVLQAGRNLPDASPQAPVYYMAVSMGFRDFGAAFAGETIPPDRDVLPIVTKTLRTQGYRLATNKNAPQMIIVYSWGTMNADRWSIDPRFPSEVANRWQILRFLGAEKMGIPMRDATSFPAEMPVGLSVMSPGARDFMELGEDSYYVIVLTAYDIDAAQQKKAVPLWSTKVSCRSIGHTLPEVLPAMLSIAAPHIGKQTARPITIRADEHYRPNIEIGPAKVIEDDVKSSADR